MTIKEEGTYAENVIKAWDAVSKKFLEACTEGNLSSKAHYLNILNADGSINLTSNQINIKRNKAVKETIDGVGTKTQIYTNQFENIFQSREKQKIDWEDAKEQATELWERMLMDLIAMNADDLRWGELAIGATNIIDINRLKWKRWHLFHDSMVVAFKRVIKTTGIAMTAWETAVLGMSHEAVKIHTVAQKAIEEIQNILNGQIVEWMSSTNNERIQEIINLFHTNMKIKSEEISFNIWWTCLGLATDENKLIPLEDGQIIIGFQEIPSNGIIGPRSNGITEIRTDMKIIMDDGRENKTFEDFLEKIWPEKSEKIPEEVKNICKEKKLRNIATGKTTVFNPFIADTLLGGIESEPIAWISALIHVTGNPLKKISEWVNKDQENNYTVCLDISKVSIPQIITLLQIALDIPDEEAMSQRNMGVPYAVICRAQDPSTIIREASKKNINAGILGNIRKQTTIEKEKNTISGVGLNKSNMVF